MLIFFVICRVHEVKELPPASSYIRHRILMYELAGDFTKKQRTSWILLIVTLGRVSEVDGCLPASSYIESFHDQSDHFTRDIIVGCPCVLSH